jgi:hypothetical protein
MNAGMEQPDFEAADRDVVDEPMDSLARSISPTDRAFQVWEWLRFGGEPPSAIIIELTKTLQKPSHYRWKQQMVAAWMLSRIKLDENQKRVASSWLVHVIQYHDHLDSGQRILRAYLRTLPVGCLLSLRLAGFTTLGVAAGFTWAFLLTFLVFPFSAHYDRKRLNRVRRMAVASLGRLKIPMTVNVLATAALEKSKLVNTEAKKSLMSVLPEVTEELYGWLPREAVPNLCRLLYDNDEAIVLALLAAIGRVGGGNALANVQRIHDVSKSARVVQAAADILPILRHRQTQERESGRLLRPAAESGVENLLLRPTENMLNADPAMLLRPSAPGGDH